MSSTRIYVGGLPNDIRTSEMMEIFHHYHPQRVDLKAGYGFIEFRDPRDADDAIHDMDGFRVDGRRLMVQPAKGTRRSRDEPDRGGRGNSSSSYSSPPTRGGNNGGSRSSSGFKVDVTGIGPRTSWQDLKDFARDAGNVVYADVFVRDGKKQGIIEYSSIEDMENALKRLDDTKLDGEMVRVYEHKDDGRGRGRSRSPGRGRSPARSPPRGRSPPRSPRGRSPLGRSPARSRSPRGRSNSRDRDDRRRSRSRSMSPRRAEKSPVA